MMKKLMVLSLVLAVSALSSAAAVGVQLVPSATEVMPGDVVTIQLIADFPVFGFNLNLASDAGGEAAVGSVNSVLTMLANPGTANVGGLLIKGATGSVFGNQVPAGGVVYDFTFIVPDIAGPLTISALNIPAEFLPSNISNATTWEVIDIAGLSTTLNVIPEPMTMGLLGLGALFLRRRK